MRSEPQRILLGLRRLGVVALAMSVSIAASARAQDAIPGFAPGRVGEQRALEARFLAVPSSSSARATVEWLAARPHLAGTPAGREVADSLAAELTRLGFDVRVERFDPWLPQPLDVDVRLVEPEPLVFPSREPSADSGAGDTAAVLFNWMAYAANDSVEAPVVYANYGLPADYAALDSANVDPGGHIVLARLGGAYRGVKVAEAERLGAVGVVLFSDPSADAIAEGDTLPAGPYRPSWSVERGTIMRMWIHTGDPLTPGRPAVDGEPRLRPEDATNLPGIPVVTIGYGAAQRILESIDGPTPDGFEGGLDVGYGVGPGPARLRITSRQEARPRPIYNVIASLEGEFDRPVILGNHFDAWVSGGADPHAGTAVTLEVARGLSALAATGWRPRRTIVIGLWDAEEYGVVGSTEWVEAHRTALAEHAVVYFNIDTFTAGMLDVTGSPALRDLVLSAAAEVADPQTGRTLADEWTDRQRTQADEESEASVPEIGDIGAGSDWTAFLHHVGVPSLQWTMNGRGTYAVYHSSLDTFDYVDRFVDPDFVHSPGLASVIGVALLQLAQADVVPFDYRLYADRIKRYIADIETRGAAAGLELETGPLHDAAANFADAAQRVAARVDTGVAAGDIASLAAIDAALPRVETAFLTADGLPGRTWYRHPINAPGRETGYDALPLPAVAEAIADGDAVAARRAIEIVRAAIARATAVLDATIG